MAEEDLSTPGKQSAITEDRTAPDVPVEPNSCLPMEEDRPEVTNVEQAAACVTEAYKVHIASLLKISAIVSCCWIC